MRLTHRTTAIVTLALCGAFAPLAAQKAAPGISAADRTSVQQFVRAYIKAHNDADATAMMESVSRDASTSSITDGEITRGWEAIRTDADEVTGAEGRFRVSIGTMDVPSLGAGHALVIAPTTITVGTDKGDVQIKGAATLVLRKTGAKWRILHEHYSTFRPDDQG